MKISTLILSAGYSRRMGETKALLELDGESLLSHIAHVAAPVSDEIVVVAGSIEHLHALTPARAAEALKSLDHPSLHIAEGQSQGHLIDSIRAGLEYISPENALLLWPIDHPFAGAELLQRMFNALKERPHSIIIPTVDNNHGHPILMAPSVMAELKTPLADEGAHHVVRKNPMRIIELRARDSRITATMNTPEQAEALGIGLNNSEEK